MPSRSQRHAGVSAYRAKDKDVSNAYHAHFSAIYGSARWKRLSKALVQETSHVAMMNAFTAAANGATSQDPEMVSVLSSGPLSCLRLRDHVPGSGYPAPPTDPATGLRSWYWLDLASVLAPLLLQPQQGDKVLDMCAAPGGKTLVLAQLMFGAVTPGSEPGPGPVINQEEQEAGLQQQHNEFQHDTTQGVAADASTQQQLHDEQCNASDCGACSHTSAAVSVGHADQSLCAVPPFRPSQLISNEADKARCSRLQRVLSEYLPADMLCGSDLLPPAVRTCSHDGDKYWQRAEPETYQRILLDVPCSSDRHVLQQAASRRGVITAAEWSEHGLKRIAALQLQLLLAGLRAVAVGGTLVYSTCSMSSVENDAVVAAALSRQPTGAVHVVHPLTDPTCCPSGLGPHQLVELFGAEATKHGLICLPDSAPTAGPLYIAVLKKTATTTNVSAAQRLGLTRLQSDDDDQEGSEEDEFDQPDEDAAA